MIRKGVDKEGNKFTVATDELRYPLKLVVTASRGNRTLQLLCQGMDLVKAEVPLVSMITLNYVLDEEVTPELKGEEITIEFKGIGLKRQALRIVKIFVDVLKQGDPAI